MTVQSFHHYEVLKTEDGRTFELGRGAMGVTYKAFDTKLQCPVTLKVISPAILENPTARERFIREARAAARLRHPNVASVIYLSCDQEPWFYVMEFIEGETLDALVKRQGALDVTLALRIALQVSEALAAAHREGIVHRDIKPSNLMLCHHGDTILLKVIDFGLAKSLAADGDATLTQGVVGTPLFASPEQLQGHEVDVRSDIYSLGVTLWHLVRGRAPFTGSIWKIINQHLNRPPPVEDLSGIPHCVVSLLNGMLQKEPSARPQTPVELKHAIQACLNELDRTQGLAEGVSPSGTRIFQAARIRAASEEAGPAPGTVLQDRFELIEEVRRDAGSVLYRALDRDTRETVAVRALSATFFASDAERVDFADELEKARCHPHRNLVRIITFEKVEQWHVMVQEWLNGFSLRTVLRARHELLLSEALPILEQAAAALDHAGAHDLTRLSLELHDIFIDFPEPLADGRRESCLVERIERWPTFLLKIMPCAVSINPAATVTDTKATRLEVRLMPAWSDLGRKHLHLLARVAYELLGGSPPADWQHYVPLANLSEAGNDAVKRCVTATVPRPFSSAQQFVETLSRDARVVPRRRNRPAVSLEVFRAAPARGFRWTRVLTGVGALATLSAISYFLFTRDSPSPQPTPTPARQASAVPTPSKDQSIPSKGGETVQTTDPKDATAGIHPTTPAFSSTVPEAVRSVDLEGLGVLREAAASGDGDAVLQLASLLQKSGRPGAEEDAIRLLKNSSDPRAMNQLGICYAQGEGTARDVPKARELFERAHQAGNLDALNNLAVIYMEVDANPAGARALLKKGAEAGNGSCMDSYARCLWEGAGGPRNQDEARIWFRKAADLGHEGSRQWFRENQ